MLKCRQLLGGQPCLEKGAEMHQVTFRTPSCAASHTSEVTGFLAARRGAGARRSVPCLTHASINPGSYWPPSQPEGTTTSEQQVGDPLEHASATNTLAADVSYTSRWVQPVLRLDKVQSLPSLAFGAGLNPDSAASMFSPLPDIRILCS